MPTTARADLTLRTVPLTISTCVDSGLARLRMALEIKRDAMYFGGDWRNENVRLVGSYIDIGENFQPEVGFVRRQDVPSPPG